MKEIGWFLFTIFASYFGVAMIFSVLQYFRDNRTGNSERHGHIDDNRRIDGPDGS